MWRSSDTQLLQALPGVLGRLQRRHCEMLEDCLVLVLKLVRCHMRPQTSRRDATTARKQHTAVPDEHSGGPAEEPLVAAGSAASTRLSSGGTGQHGGGSSSDQQEGVSDAASCAEGEFLHSFAAFASALPHIVQAWPEATCGGGMLRTFLLRCCATTADMHINAEAPVLSRLAPHQRRAIFGTPGRPLADDMTAPAQQILADAAAAVCGAGFKIGEASTAEEQGAEASLLWQAEEVALGVELLMHAALLRRDVAAALRWPTDAAALLPQAARSSPFLLDAAGKSRVCPYLQLITCRVLLRSLKGPSEQKLGNGHLLVWFRSASC